MRCVAHYVINLWIANLHGYARSALLKRALSDYLPRGDLLLSSQLRQKLTRRLLPSQNFVADLISASSATARVSRTVPTRCIALRALSENGRLLSRTDCPHSAKNCKKGMLPQVVILQRRKIGYSTGNSSTAASRPELTLSIGRACTPHCSSVSGVCTGLNSISRESKTRAKPWTSTTRSSAVNSVEIAFSPYCVVGFNVPLIRTRIVKGSS